jgi:hypothetical protein
MARVVRLDVAALLETWIKEDQAMLVGSEELR